MSLQPIATLEKCLEVLIGANAERPSDRGRWRNGGVVTWCLSRDKARNVMAFSTFFSFSFPFFLGAKKQVPSRLHPLSTYPALPVYPRTNSLLSRKPAECNIHFSIRKFGKVLLFGRTVHNFLKFALNPPIDWHSCLLLHLQLDTVYFWKIATCTWVNNRPVAFFVTMIFRPFAPSIRSTHAARCVLTDLIDSRIQLCFIYLRHSDT